MKNLNEIVGENLTFLRKKAGYTQLELGEKFNYSDKTVSKWEQGSVLPSVDVLKEIADFYGVSVDYVLSEHNTEKEFKSIIKQTPNFTKKALLVALVITLIFTIGTVIYFAKYLTLKTFDPVVNRWWITFLWCVPISFLILIFSSKHIFRHPLNTLIFSSLFVWTILASAYIQWMNKGPYWFLLFIGLPLQIALIIIYNLRK